MPSEAMVRPSPAALSPLQLTASEEEFLRTYAGVVNSQLSQLPQHSIDQGESAAPRPATPFPGAWLQPSQVGVCERRGGATAPSHPRS